MSKPFLVIKETKFGQQKFGSDIFLGQKRIWVGNFFLGKKKMGWKFALAKFYFCLCYVAGYC